MILQDVIVQTDQRLTFLVQRDEESRIKWNKTRPPNEGGHSGAGDHMKGSYKPTYTEKGCQTYIEVSSVAIQVDVSELKNMCGAPMLKTKTQINNYEDVSDFSDADISTVHPSVTPASSSNKRRLIRKKDGTFLGIKAILKLLHT